MTEGAPRIENILEVWRVHEEINLFLLEHIPDAAFQAVTPGFESRRGLFLRTCVTLLDFKVC